MAQSHGTAGVLYPCTQIDSDKGDSKYDISENCEFDTTHKLTFK